MGFVPSVRHSLRNYAVFSGRASRAEFWWFQLFYFLGTMAAAVLDGAVSGHASSGGWISALWSLALLLPSISLLVRRLHDIDRTGWWVLLMLLPAVGMLVLLVFALIRGSAGRNRFGPPPGHGAPDPYADEDWADEDWTDDAGTPVARTRIPPVPRAGRGDNAP
ncbi:hypothetical protein BV394_07510 [Brevirhabdus pacifica]|uniref:Uncharacterized protein n=2 Tax=Brevirhabdus pacifica TaxID=1267768 RepID=A0A1U7DI79_9RHOB|nr:DUF805 domain-containing protein [Brevirhabdus pacifica]APX89578.1 hypothetical protein BV394_07510 [Brevirhabdus pacifica]PJJ85754.1 uncharacterized membrane protein YhaH (DUF805 family) [Brevirhabdus pacifica]